MTKSEFDLAGIILDWNVYDIIRAMKKQSDSDSDVKCATVHFYNNNHNSHSDS
jgi:hypothetical protein